MNQKECNCGLGDPGATHGSSTVRMACPVHGDHIPAAGAIDPWTELLNELISITSCGRTPRNGARCEECNDVVTKFEGMIARARARVLPSNTTQATRDLIHLWHGYTESAKLEAREDIVMGARLAAAYQDGLAAGFHRAAQQLSASLSAVPQAPDEPTVELTATATMTPTPRPPAMPVNPYQSGTIDWHHWEIDHLQRRAWVDPGVTTHP